MPTIEGVFWVKFQDIVKKVEHNASALELVGLVKQQTLKENILSANYLWESCHDFFFSQFTKRFICIMEFGLRSDN